MALIIVKVMGAKRAAYHLHTYALNMRSFSRAYEDVGDFFRNEVRAQFNGGGGWAPLAPYTIIRRGGGSQPLVDSGALEASWTIAGGPSNINITGAMTAKFGSAHSELSNIGVPMPIAAMHQSGTTHMPARPVKLVDGALEEKIVDAFIDHIFGGF